MVHQETVSLSPGLDDPAGRPLSRSLLSRNHRHDFPQRLSPEREGGVDYSRRAAPSVAAAAPRSRLTSVGHPGPSRITSRVPHCSTPPETAARTVAFRCRRSSPAAASSVERRDARVVWRRKGHPRGLLAAGAPCRRRRQKSGWRRRCKW